MLFALPPQRPPPPLARLSCGATARHVNVLAAADCDAASSCEGDNRQSSLPTLPPREICPHLTPPLGRLEAPPHVACACSAIAASWLAMCRMYGGGVMCGYHCGL